MCQQNQVEISSNRWQAGRQACPPAICVCCLQRVVSGLGCPTIWSNMQCHMGLDGSPKRHGHKFSRACVRRGLANCQTYVCAEKISWRAASTHNLFDHAFPDAFLSTFSPPLHSPPLHIWRKRTNCQDRQSNRWSNWAWASARDHRNQSQFTPNVVAVVVDRPCCPIRRRVALSVFLVVKDKQIVCL